MAGQSDYWVGFKLAGGRYEVTAKLGEGGMGHIYRARDANLDADVVIKVPRRGVLLEDPEFGERFSREIRSLVKLSHPHVVKVSDVGEHDGLPFAVMQYLSGGSLHDRRPLVYLTLLRRAIESVTFHAGGRVALLTLRPDGLPAEALPMFNEDDFINLPRSLADVEVVAQLKLSTEGDWKIGFRSKGKVNVQAIASSLGGGGPRIEKLSRELVEVGERL